MTVDQGPAPAPAVRGRSAAAWMAAALACITAASAAPVARADAPAAASNRLIVGFDDRASAGTEARTLDAAGATEIRDLPSADAVLVRVDPGVTRAQAERSLDAAAAVDFAEPDYRVTTAAAATDPMFGSLWGLHNLGGSGGVLDADIDAPEAWDLATGSGVVVAVTDTGADLTHPDLAPSLWTNPGEIAGNGLDDDADGWADDVNGIDTANGDGSPADDNGHGSHVAGTIAAAANNGIGVAGVAYGAKVMPLKFMTANGSGYTSAAITAIDFARANGATVVNASWGGAGYSEALRQAILAAGQAGVVVVAAAGNESRNTDAAPSYPADYDLPNVISVAASDRADGLAPYSNRGACSVDLAAPGSGILSTVPGGYSTYSGTSMAAPHAAGVAALILSRAPGQSAADVRARILGTADPQPAFAGVTVTGGRLNARAAVATAAGPVPAIPASCGQPAPAPAPAPALAPVRPPAISGAVVEGQILTAVAAAWTTVPSRLVRQWQRCDERGQWCEAIPGAAGPSYRLAAPDVGATIRVKETATVGAQQASSVSPATAMVRAAPVVTPLLTVSVAASQPALARGGIAARVGCTATCRVAVTVALEVPATVRARGRVRVGARGRTVRAVRAAASRWTRNVIVALTGAQRQAAAAGLRRGQVVRAVVSFQGIDASGGRSATVVRSVRITG